MDDRRDTQPGLFDQVFLYLVGKRGAFGWREVARPTNPRDVPDTVLQNLGSLFFKREQLVNPRAAKLGQLLVDCHLGQQITDPRLDRLGSIQVSRSFPVEHSLSLYKIRWRGWRTG